MWPYQNPFPPLKHKVETVYIDKKSGEQGGTALCNKLLEEDSFKSANFKAFM